MKPFYTDWDEFKDAQLCNAWVATAIAGSAAIGAGAQIWGASKAKDAQQNAAYTAAATQMNMYNQTRADLQNYRDTGNRALSTLETDLPYLTSPIDVTKELQNPDSVSRKAYDFSLTQGNKAVQNSAAARGLGVSGAALKGAANFTTGLVDNTYKTLFDIENANRTNAYTRLKGLVDTGAAAAGATGSLGEKAAYNAGQAQIGAGNAGAAAATSTGGAFTNFANNVGGYAAYKGLYGNKNNNNDNNEVPIGTTG